MDKTTKGTRGDRQTFTNSKYKTNSKQRNKNEKKIRLSADMLVKKLVEVQPAYTVRWL